MHAVVQSIQNIPLQSARDRASTGQIVAKMKGGDLSQCPIILSKGNSHREYRAPVARLPNIYRKKKERPTVVSLLRRVS